MSRTVVLTQNARQVIARSGDTDVSIQLDAQAWHTAYPSGLPYLMVYTPANVPVPVTVVYADNMITGDVPDELLVRPGMYRYEFAWLNAGTQVQSGACGCIVQESEHSYQWNPHTAAPDWADRIFLAAETIEAAFDGAIEAEAAALDAQDAAETAQGKAEDAQEAAETAQGKAEDAQEAAETAAANAETHNYGISVDGTTLEITPPLVGR